MKSKESEEKIIFFDGVCNLCNGFVDFLMKRDKKKRLRYAPLQGSTALERLPLSRVKIHSVSGPEFTSVVFLNNGVMSLQSDAALNVLAQLGGIWRLATLFKFIPRSIRDSIYQSIAKNRYRWFGQRETCRLPSKEEKQLFLD